MCWLLTTRFNKITGHRPGSLLKFDLEQSKPTPLKHKRTKGQKGTDLDCTSSAKIRLFDAATTSDLLAQFVEHAQWPALRIGKIAGSTPDGTTLRVSKTTKDKVQLWQ